MNFLNCVPFEFLAVQKPHSKILPQHKVLREACLRGRRSEMKVLINCFFLFVQHPWITSANIFTFNFSCQSRGRISKIEVKPLQKDSKELPKHCRVKEAIERELKTNCISNRKCFVIDHLPVVYWQSLSKCLDIVEWRIDFNCSRLRNRTPKKRIHEEFINLRLKRGNEIGWRANRHGKYSKGSAGNKFGWTFKSNRSSSWHHYRDYFKRIAKLTKAYINQLKFLGSLSMRKNLKLAELEAARSRSYCHQEVPVMKDLEDRLSRFVQTFSLLHETRSNIDVTRSIQEIMGSVSRVACKVKTTRNSTNVEEACP